MQIETPVNLSKRPKKRLREFEALGPGRNTNPRAQSFMDKVKSFFTQ